jgi:hypothetical protein
MILLDTQPPNPDGFFWYSVSAVLFSAFFGLLIWLISRYLTETKEFSKSVKETLQRLVTNDAVKEQRLNDIDERLDGIEDKVYPINYKKGRNG